MTNLSLFVQGIVSGTRFFTADYTWPSKMCIKENEPDFFCNVGAYAKDIWEKIRRDGGLECQTEIKV